ncbi:PDR/VanB family oxidoreductase [Nocardia sp. BMG51109]|uniref:PDR/VanB family oxidoreductase n=1 Tax=Nocardia sp. BMG51109 TaxID=1056816 RepID=UPI0004B0AA87|nr:PDR/VanB family oxidoreductase [Nocardia sp. BMG51109]
MTDDLTVRLVAVEYGAAGINRYRFAPLGDEPLPAFEPGAHIDVRVAAEVVKQYSLIWSAGDTGRYEIAVRAGDRDGSSSRHLHHESVVGSDYRISTPRNNFGIDAEGTEHHLFAGGIGITPLISMYRWLTASKSTVRMDYWSPTADRTLFRDELADAPGVSLFATAAGSAPRLADRIPGVPSHAHLYCCGPPAMVDEFDRLTADRDPALVHRERFTAPAVDRPADAFTVTLHRSGRVLTVPANRSILEICCEAGVDAEFSCEEGVCGACEVKVLAGAVDHRDTVLGPAERAGHDRMMICCSRGRGDLVIDL